KACEGRDLSCPEGQTLLHLCAGLNRTEMADAMMALHGADPTVIDDEKRLPLHTAAQKGAFDAFATFKRKSDVTARMTADWTCLHLAAQEGHVRIIAALLSDPQFRPHVGAITAEGYNALHLAATHKKSDAVRQLVPFFDPNQPVNPHQGGGDCAIHLA